VFPNYLFKLTVSDRTTTRQRVLNPGTLPLTSLEFAPHEIPPHLQITTPHIQRLIIGLPAYLRGAVPSFVTNINNQ
jgi:hypothetical protein